MRTQAFTECLGGAPHQTSSAHVVLFNPTPTLQGGDYHLYSPDEETEAWRSYICLKSPSERVVELALNSELPNSFPSGAPQNIEAKNGD